MRLRLGLPLAAALSMAGPAFADEHPALPLQPAAVLDPASFSHAVPVRARPSAAGVSVLRLSPAILALAQEDLADLRVIDGASRQWPFVPVPDAGHEPLPLRVEPARAAAGQSRWRLVPPVAPVAIDGVTLRIDRERFDRAYRLVGELPGERTVNLGSGRLARAGGMPVEIVVGVPRQRVQGLAILVDDGDEAPLPLVEARASALVAELRLVAPAGDYTLLAGDPAAHAPRYEIAGAREQVLGARAGEAEVGAPAPNPAQRPRLPQGEERERIALWAVMGAAVVALAGLTLRLARKTGAPPRS